MDPTDLSRLKQLQVGETLNASVRAQTESRAERTTRDGKSFRELQFTDGVERVALRVWQDSAEYAATETLDAGSFVEIEGTFQRHPNFGVEARAWKWRLLEEAEKVALLAGSEESAVRVDQALTTVREIVATLVDPRFRRMAEMFLEEHEKRWRRTGGARQFHHARRGGLVEHTAQMMRAAAAICGVYPVLNRDLLLTGALFHDCGKMWENAYHEEDFVMPFTETGELLGHIMIGVELVNVLWRRLRETPEFETWSTLVPPSEQVRLHLLHLVVSHHGEPQFGSPVVPRTPEAYALHLIDNLDAKLEMIFAGYKTAQPLGSHVFERVRPLPGNLVAPLKEFQIPAGPEVADDVPVS